MCVIDIDPPALQASLRRLATQAGAGDDSSVVSALIKVTEACVDLFDVAGSGIMVADEQNVYRHVAASDEAGRTLELLESELGQGPCTDAFIHDQVVSSPDLLADPRWPDLAAGMVAQQRVRAVVGVPVRLGGVTVGTLDVYRDHPAEWDSAELTALTRYAEVIGSTLVAALSAHQAGELAAQLQYALDYRVVIERGVGYLMGTQGIDEVTAFNRLRRAARGSRRKIGEVAQELLESGRLSDTATGDRRHRPEAHGPARDVS